MPATGLINRESKHCFRCDYVILFPGSLILLNSLLSIVPIVVVVGLYSIILVKALNNVKKIKKADKYQTQENESKLRINRANTNAKTMTTVYDMKSPRNNVTKLKRSASYSVNLNNIGKSNGRPKSKSIDDLTNHSDKPDDYNNEQTKSQYDSKFSVCTIETSCSDNYTLSNNNFENISKKNYKDKRKRPNKWRAITVVMLTSGSFVCTWVPFFIIVIFYVLCEDKLTNPQCVHYRTLQSGPMAILAFFNSILNPLIYAWWHKGFQRTMINYFRKYCCSKLKQFSSSDS